MRVMQRVARVRLTQSCCYYYYAAFNAPCVGHKDDESQAGCYVYLRVAVSVMKRFEFLFESVCNDVQVASDDVR